MDRVRVEGKRKRVGCRRMGGKKEREKRVGKGERRTLESDRA